MPRTYNHEIVSTIRTFLDGDHWRYTFDDDKGLFRYNITLKGKLKSTQCIVIVNDSDYSVFAISPVSANQNDPEQMRKMAEFTCRANYGLKDGNFEMDFNDGELRYKCHVNCDGLLPSREVVTFSIQCPAMMIDRYSEAIAQILFCDMDAKEAVALCEKGTAPRTPSAAQTPPTPSTSASAGQSGDTGASRLMDLLRSLRSGQNGAGNVGTPDAKEA